MGGRVGERAGAAPAPKARKNGFTLVELMVVVMIIGLAAAVAVLAMPDPRGQLTDEATRFAGRVRAAHDLSIVQAQPVSIWITPTGYGFDVWQGGRWSALAEAPFRVDRWSDGTRALGANRQRVTFDPTGLADRPLQVTLNRENTRVTVSIAGDGSVRVTG